MTVCPDMELRLHALVDGELDAGHALEVEAHLAGCAGCAAELAAIREVKGRLAASPLRYAAPASLTERLEAATEAETAPPPEPRRRGLGVESWVFGGSITALAASLALFALVPSGASLEAQLVDAQARSLQAQHLVDIATSDRHTVKPWFNGKVDFAPPVVDLAPQGYPLVGGRLDHVGGRDVAALVFRRRAHVINLFIWPGDKPPSASLEGHEGYNLVSWGEKGLTLWAVSDVDAGDLLEFQRQYAAATK